MGQKHSGSLDITTSPGTYRPKSTTEEEGFERHQTASLATPAYACELQTGDSGYEGDKDKHKSSSESEDAKVDREGSKRKTKKKKKNKDEESDVSVDVDSSKITDYSKKHKGKKLGKKDTDIDHESTEGKERKHKEMKKEKNTSKNNKKKEKKKGESSEDHLTDTEEEAHDEQKKKKTGKTKKKEKKIKEKKPPKKVSAKESAEHVQDVQLIEGEIQTDSAEVRQKNVKSKKKSETSCCGKKKKTVSDDESRSGDLNKKEKKKKAPEKKKKRQKTKTESTDPIIANEEFEMKHTVEVQPPKKQKSLKSPNKKRTKDIKSDEEHSSPGSGRNIEVRSSLHREKRQTSVKRTNPDSKTVKETFEKTSRVQEEAIVRSEAMVIKPDFRFDDLSSCSSSLCDSECEGDCQLHRAGGTRVREKTRKKGSGKKSTKVGGSEQFREYLCHVDDMNDGEMREFVLKRGKKILLIREQGHYHALSTVCPNDNSRLVDGVLHQGRIRCSQDGACFNITSGKIEDFPGLNSLHKFEVEVESSHVTLRGLSKDLNTIYPIPAVVTHDPEIDKTKVLILGDGPGAVKCAETLRQEGFRGEIAIASSCSNATNGPFDQSKLTDVITTHKIDACSLRNREFFSDRDINLAVDMKVFQIDLDKRHVTFIDGSCTKYDFLVIAAPPRWKKLSEIEGCDARGIFYLNQPDDALNIAKESRSKHVVILGGTLQALELASHLHGKAKTVDIVMSDRQPMLDAGDRVGEQLKEIYAVHHIKFHSESDIVKFNTLKGRVHEVELSSGEKLLCDVCLVAQGHEPSEVYKTCGLTVTAEGYIVTDKETRTSRSGVFALGGNARSAVRYSHYQQRSLVDNLVKMEYALGHTAALTILSRTHDVHYVPYYSTHLLNNLISCAGLPHDHDDVTIHHLDVGGTPGKRHKTSHVKFVAFYIKSGKVCAVLGVNCGLVVAQAAELFSIGRSINGDEVKRSALSWTHKLHHTYNATTGAITM